VETFDRSQEVFLVVKPSGNFGLSVRVAVRRPRLDADEVAMHVAITVPDALFRRPQLEAAITVPREQVNRPTINAQVLDNIRETLQQALGVDMRIAVVEQGGGDAAG
jgi:hypothetical protein